MRYSLGLFVLLALAGLSFSANFSACTNIDSSGVWVLTQDLSGAPVNVGGNLQGYSLNPNTACIVIHSSNVLLDCGGHTIDYGAVPPDLSSIPHVFGIVVNDNASNPFTNVTVRNCVVNNYTVNIYAQNLSNSVFGGDTIHSQYPHFGLRCDYNCNNNLVENITIDGPYAGIDWLNLNDVPGEGGNGNRFNNLAMTGISVIGIDVEGSNNNVTNSRIACDPSFSGWGYEVGGSANGNLFQNDYATGCDIGYIVWGSGNTITNDSASDSWTYSADGYNIYGPSNVVSSSYAHNLSGTGFSVSGAGSNVTSDTSYNNSIGFSLSSVLALGDWAHDNSGDGFSVGDSTVVVNGISSNNGGNGYSLIGSSNNVIAGDTGYGNALNGILIQSAPGGSGEGGPFPPSPSSGNNLSGTAVYNNGRNGILVDDSFGAGSTLNYITGSYSYSNGIDGIQFLELSLPNSLIGNGNIYGNGGNGIHLINSSQTNVTGNQAFNNAADGFLAENCTGSYYSYDTATSNGNDGFETIGSPGELFQSNTANSNALYGFMLNNPSSVPFNGNRANNNGFYGFYFISPASFNAANDIATGGQIGFIVVSGSGSSFINDSTTGYTSYGFYTPDTSDSLFFNDFAATTSGSTGFYVSQSASNNVIANSTATGNQNYGFRLESVFSDVMDDVFANNTATNNVVGYGLLCSQKLPIFALFANNTAAGNVEGFNIQCVNNTFSGNQVQNSEVGFGVFSDNNTLAGNLVHNINGTGIEVFGARTYVSGGRLFANSPDMRVSPPSGSYINLSGVVFDNPAGTLSSFTNLSINDSIGGADSYTLNWSSQPAPTPGSPGSYFPFAGKFINITNLSSVSIDSIYWTWGTSELSGYSENRFELWKNDGGWVLVSDTPDTANNRFALTNLNSFSVFGILQNNLTTNISALKMSQTAAPPSQGGLLQYNITINNTGGLNLNPVTVVDILPNGVTPVSASPAPDSINGPMLTWNNLGPMAPNGSRVIYINATVTPGVFIGGPVPTVNPVVNITNYVNATGTDKYGNVAAASSTANVTAYYADVAVFKVSSAAGPPSPGGVVLFTITANNTGAATLNNVTISDYMPGQVTYLSSSPTASVVNGSVVSWTNLGPVAPGATAVVQMNATVNPGVVNASNPSIMLFNCGSAMGSPPNGNNVSGGTCSVFFVYYANVSVMKVDVTPVLTSPGGLVQWKINVSNPGAVTLNPVAVADTLPAGFTYASASPAADSAAGQAVSWTNIGPIAPGGYSVILLNTTVAGDVQNGTYVNSVTAAGTPPNGNTVNASDTAEIGIFAPGISVVKTLINTSQVVTTLPIPFAINVTNTGSINLSIDVLDTHEAVNLTFNGSSVPPASVTNTTILWANYTVLQPGQSSVIYFNLTSINGKAYVNNVTATGYPPNGNSASDNSSAPFRVIFPIPPGTPQPGSTLSVSFRSNCSGNTVSVTSSGSPVQGAQVMVDGNAIDATDSGGQTTFQGCGKRVIVRASVGGSQDAVDVFQLVDCGKCEAKCTSDAQCSPTQSCQTNPDPALNQCVPVSCSCGQTAEDHQCKGTAWQCGPGCNSCPAGQSCSVDHLCKPAGCTSDSQCPETQACVSGSGAPATVASPGSCQNVTGQCGEAKNHTWVPFGYQCGSEPGCPSCPSSQTCVQHQCLTNDISCPSTGIVGTNKTCLLTENDAACGPEGNCTAVVTAPDGKNASVTPDENGNVQVPLSLQGRYVVTLLKNGQVVKEVFVDAVPQAAPQPPTTAPSGAGSGIYSMWWLLVLLLIVIGAVIYWRSRGQKSG